MLPRANMIFPRGDYGHLYKLLFIKHAYVPEWILFEGVNQ